MEEFIRWMVSDNGGDVVKGRAGPKLDGRFPWIESCVDVVGMGECIPSIAWTAQHPLLVFLYDYMTLLKMRPGRESVWSSPYLKKDGTYE
jgi:hypothetical protein